MHYRFLGRTGLRISEIGFGAWGIGKTMWVGAEDEESKRALHRAIDLGVNFIDTAWAYGSGHSERLIGEVLQHRRERVYVATKIPPANWTWPAPPGIPVREAFPKAHILRYTEASLRNLGVECIDVQQFHVWNDEWTHDPLWREAVEQLKAEGKIRFFGISINDHQPENSLEVIRRGLVDTVQVIYNLFEQQPEDKLFPLCQEMNIGVIARVPFDEGALTGALTGETTFPEGDWRNQYFRGDRKKQVEERVHKIQADLQGTGLSLPEAALRFCLSHPAVSTVIPGMRRVRHVEANCRAGDGKGLPPEIRKKLQSHAWVKNFYE